MKLTSFLSVSQKDFLKSFIVAIISGVFAFIAPAVQSGEFSFDWTTIWHTAVAAGVAYLAKNFFSPAPKTVQIDPEKTSVVDKTTKKVILNSGN